MWSLSLATAPEAEPLDLATEVKQQLRLQDAEIAAQAAVLAGYIGAARRACEHETGRQLITATWDLVLDSWYEEGIYRCEGGIERLRLPKPPVSAITYVKYWDSAGAEQTWGSANYLTSLPTGETAGRAEIALAYGASWPTLQARAQAATVRFVTGYGAAYSDVPTALRAGMLIDVYLANDMPEPRLAEYWTKARDAKWWDFRTW